MIRLPIALCPLALSITLLAGGCGESPPPPSVAQAEQAVQTAEAQNGGANAPEAMKEARSRLAGAQRAVRDGFPGTADKLAQEAIAAAQLAQGRSEQATEQAGLNYVNGTGSSPILPHSGVPQQPATSP